MTVPLYAETGSIEDDADEARVAAMMQRDDVLSLGDIRSLIAKMWQLHLQERQTLDRVYEYVKGDRGRPEVPEGASDEVKDLAKLAVKNVLALVRESFAQNLSVVGYRNATAKEDDPAWDMWQRNKMDARQAEVYRPSLTYGAAYVTVTPSDKGPVFRPRSPRQILAVYDDPTLDDWPQFALETWVTQKDAKLHRKGRLFDERYMYTLDLGYIPVGDADNGGNTSGRVINVAEVEDIEAHGATFEGEPVCPVVRFVNSRDADDMIVGEVEPLITLQQSLNSVNFDRLIVSRFGANPQRVITGWAGTKQEVLKASAMRVWTFDDPDVKAQAFPAASVEPYNSIIEEMLQHIAMVAQISPSQVTGKMVNVSAEALAAAEANQQRKLAAKRESFGESWEQVLKLGAEMSGAQPDAAAETVANPGAEVVWRDTEARSFAAVVDGVTKLAAAGVPIEHMLTLVPGMTQQQIVGIKEAMRGGQVSSLVDKLLGAPTPPTDTTQPPPIDQVLADVNQGGSDATTGN